MFVSALAFAVLALPSVGDTSLARAEAATAAVVESQRDRLPADVVVDSIRPAGDAVRIRLRGSFAPIDEVREELLLEGFAGAFVAFEVGTPAILEIETQTGHVRPLGGSATQTGNVHHGPRPQPPVTQTSEPPKNRATKRYPFGTALAGRRIAISAGHGWLPDGAGWRTQRSLWNGCGSCRGVVEDFLTQEIVSRQLLPLLQQMGAEVVLVREPNLRADVAQVVVDDGDPTYSEVGTWGNGSESDAWAGDYRTNADTDLGSAAFAFEVVSNKPTRLALRYREGQNRTTSAVVSVNHSAGTRTFNIDQTTMGRHWLDLGSYVFGPGSSVEVAHGPAAGFLVADAIKAGGGIFASSEKPFWEMSAQEFVPWSGAPTAVTSRSDVTIRPAFAETMNPDLYISIHANASGVAGGSSANGLSTYRYSCGTYPDFTSSAGASACDDPPGSTALADAVHAALIASLHGEWDPNFGNRGKLVANFGEIRVLDDTPGILVETAFFDNITAPSGSPPPSVNDNTALHDPRWREAFARGLATGIAQYLTGGTAPPERPTHLAARNLDDGTLEVTWAAVSGALGYRVYRSLDGRAFDEGIEVDGVTSLVVSDLDPREVVVFRVAALDDNGEGFASRAVGARFRGAQGVDTPSAGLLVTAFERRDSRVQDEDNDLTYAVELAHAFGSTDRDFFFDGALNEVINDDANALQPYDVVLWHAGKDSTFHKPFSALERDAVRAHSTRGGAVFASGEEIGWALVSTSTDPDDEAFLADVFGATFVADDASTYELQAPGTGPFAGVPDATFDDGSGGIYEVKYPDVFAPIAGAQIALNYPDDTGAAIVNDRAIVLGTPLETVVPASARNALAAASVDFFLPSLSTGDLDGDGAVDACEQAEGFDWRDASDAAAALERCEGIAPPPVDAGPDEDAGPIDDAGVGPEDDAGATPTPAPTPGVPEPGTPGPELERFRIAPEPGCACVRPRSTGALSLLIIGFGLAFLFRRRPSHQATACRSPSNGSSKTRRSSPSCK